MGIQGLCSGAVAITTTTTSDTPKIWPNPSPFISTLNIPTGQTSTTAPSTKTSSGSLLPAVIVLVSVLVIGIGVVVVWMKRRSKVHYHRVSIEGEHTGDEVQLLVFPDANIEG